MCLVFFLVECVVLVVVGLVFNVDKEILCFVIVLIVYFLLICLNVFGIVYIRYC